MAITFNLTIEGSEYDPLDVGGNLHAALLKHLGQIISSSLPDPSHAEITLQTRMSAPANQLTGALKYEDPAEKGIGLEWSGANLVFCYEKNDEEPAKHILVKLGIVTDESIIWWVFPHLVEEYEGIYTLPLVKVKP